MTTDTKAIIVTGTPGTGKTTVAEKLARKLGYQYADVNRMISEEKLSSGYDRHKKCKIVDEKKLVKALARKINHSDAGLVIDSHLAHHLPTSAAEACIVTKCNLKLLKKRLKRRKYSEQKIRENLDCEIFDVCLNEAKEAGHHVIIVETDKDVDYEKLINKIKGKKKK